MPEIHIVQMEGKRQIRDWLAVPHTVFAGDPMWIAPLDFQEKQRIAPDAPFFTFGEAAFFIAYKQGAPVGRISAHINHRHLELYKDATGHFGFFDCIDDAAVAEALVDAAADWLRTRGMRRMLGPESYSLNDECGCLVAGFNSPPAILMPHHRTWTGPLLERAGLVKAMDLFAYRSDPNNVSPRIKALAARVEKMPQFKLRPLNLRKFDDEIKLLVDIFNDSWRSNWGFVPFSPIEIEALAKELRPFMRAEYGRFLMLDGVEVGMIIGLPDINGIIADFKGKLLPFNWIRLIWALRTERWHSARILLMGLRQAQQSTAAGGALLALMINALFSEGANRRQLKWAEMSWVLETNKRMVGIAETFIGPPVKTYRIYEKAIAPAP